MGDLGVDGMVIHSCVKLEVLTTVIIICYDMIYLLTAIGLAPGCSTTVHIHTQTIHRTTQNKQYIEQHKHFGRVRAVIPWHLPYN
jgi:hypothetical protein